VALIFETAKTNMKKLFLSRVKKIKGKKRGQSFVELMIVTLILALLLAGVVEFGFLLNTYLKVIDGAREAARFSSSSVAFYSNGTSIDAFYYNTSVEAARVMSPLTLDPANGDDIVISVLSVAGSSVVRFPSPTGWSLCQHYAGFTSSFTSVGKPVPSSLSGSGWNSCSTHLTHFSTSDLMSRLDTTAPPSGVLVVEIFYSYPQILKLPIFTNSDFSIIPDPIPVYAYTIMPISSAEPTPTPRP
jgi:hypothetical protein